MTERRPATNQEVLDALTERAEINEGHVSVVLDNSTFRIHISCGEFIGAPRKVLKNLADYELVTVELWYHKDDPEDAKSVTTKTFTLIDI